MSLRNWDILDLELAIVPFTPYEPPKVEGSPVFQLPTAKEITLAEYDVSCQGVITAHRISDYRRRKFSLVLLPNVNIWIDDLFLVPEVTDGAVL